MKKRSRPLRPDGREEGEQSPRLELNRRQRAIVESGILGRLRPSALVVLHYAIAHADFSTCVVYLGGRTVADRARLNRSSVRAAIRELIDCGILVVKKARTFTRATTYRISAPTDRVDGSTLGGWRAPPWEGGRFHPGRVDGSTPNPTLHASRKRSMRNRPSANAEDDSPDIQQARLHGLRKLKITPRHVAGAAGKATTPEGET